MYGFFSYLYSVPKNQDPCRNNLCENGATCVADVESYKCVCADGFEGRYCQGMSSKGSQNSRRRIINKTF